MKRAHQLSADDLSAWDATQRAAWHFNQFTKEDFAVTTDLLRAVIATRPDFVLALSYLAFTRFIQVLFTWADDTPAALMEAHQLSITALAADPMHPMANVVHGVMQAIQGNHKAGIVAARRGIELNPSFAFAHHAVGAIYMFNGQPLEAIAEFESAIRLSPFDSMRPIWLSTKSASHYLAGDYERALEAADSALQIAPHYVLGLRGRANALALLGRMDEARAALDDFLAVSPNYTVATGRAGVPFSDEAVFQHYMDGLRLAGLPEE